jgi:hypothetical protein
VSGSEAMPVGCRHSRFPLLGFHHPGQGLNPFVPKQNLL